ncbi:MAG TPA: oxidoreductase C-terminal domain-containing protein, partial [Gaiellaceae bacterium]|nr:oxidoreductase C-terminal domain-containing protein [Gaiellaceae bacterium]
TTLVLTNGDRLAADVVLVSIGAKPDRSLLTADPPAGVHVCGDVRGPGHWTSAAHDAVAAAHAILGLEAPAPQPRYAWSDQFGLRLQLVGEPGRAARVELDGAESSFTARYRDGEGRLLAVLLANRPDGVARARRELPLAA